MARIEYINPEGLSQKKLDRIDTINGIVREYMADGYVLTLRQLYYQLVSRDIIPNKQSEYAKLSDILKDGRMAGLIDWAAIEDRGRKPYIPYYVTGVPDALDDIHNQYRLDRMAGQAKYIEVWVEKDALSNVFRRVTEKYHVNLMVNKGYSSCSAMHEAHKRFRYHWAQGRPGVLLYFGDHDPSGKDMVRDIRERMLQFGLPAWAFTVYNPALSMEQIEAYDLPENPAKITDPRAKEYITTYGIHSWELDALEPSDLIDIIDANILPHINVGMYEDMLEKEESEKAEILKIKERYENT